MIGNLRSARLLAVLILLVLVNAPGLQAQTRSITGVVKSDNEALPGVTVIEKGTNNGTVTDSEGRFTLSVSEGAVLVVSFVGMKQVEVQVGNQSSLTINMEVDATELEEVVVIGYGTAKKSELTGSIASITGEDLKKVPVSTIAETLTGRLPGVQVMATEGSPDAEIRIRVRGGGSITQDNSPLYIVDGFPVNNISDISPSDIKSIDVLKDASSTAIYGSRGANGVVIITTKGGTDGKVSVSFNSFFGAKRIAKTLDVLNPADYVNWQYEYAAVRFGINSLQSYENFFGAWQDQDLYVNLRGNDWQRQVYGRTGQVFSNDLSVRGGSDKFKYSINYARFEDKAIMVGSDFNRNNFTVNLNNKASDKIEIGFTLRYAETKISGGGANEQNEVSSADSRLKHAVTYSPIPMPGLTTDETEESIASYFIDPLVATADNDRQQGRRNYNMATSVTWNIVKNLQWRSDLGYDNYDYNDNRFYGLTTYYVNNAPASENQGRPAAIFRNRKENRIRNTNTLSYDLKEHLGSGHKAKILFGHEMLRTQTNELTSVIHGYPQLFTSVEAFKLTTQGKPQSTDNFFSPDDKLVSFFVRANYDFKGRYLFQATYRADGSSKFLDDNRWGFFPSVGGAWRVSEEAFMTGTSNWLNDLKLRASYGVAGNNNIPVGQTVQAYASSITAWMNGFDSFWAPSNRLANPELKWETTYTRNIGLDFSTLKGRLNGTLEVYQNNTKDLLIEFPIAGTGYQTQFRNMGETENKGIEAAINYIAIDRQSYGLNFSFNIGVNRNEIKSLGLMDAFGAETNWASTDIGNDFWVFAGGSVGMMYGYKNAGRYTVDDFEGYNPSTGNWILKGDVTNSSQVVGTLRPGMLKLVDITGDNNVTIDDRTIIGNANPKHTGGIVINGYAFGFDLMAAFNWSYGNDIYNANKIEYTTSTPRFQYRNMIDLMGSGSRWTNINPDNGSLVTDPSELAALNANTTMWSPYMSRFVFSDWAVEDGSFLRLNTLTLGYTLPSSVVQRLRLQSLRFYTTGYNVFVLTNYSGFDPEVSTRRRTPLTPGVDYSAYPRSRQLVFGFNLTF